jgi:hypothetical protein
MATLESDGHVPMTYFWTVDSKDPRKGISSGGFGPRYSTGYCSLRNRPSLLVETHALKTYRTRVIGHYNIMLHTLELLNRDPDSLRRAVKQADADAVRMGSAYDPDFRLPLAVGRTNQPKPFTFKGYAYQTEQSEVSGAERIIYDNTKPIEFETEWRNTTEVTREVSPPLAYLIPPQWTEVIELLGIHGLRHRRLTQPVTGRFESYRFQDVSFPERPYEGRFSPRFEIEPIVESRTYPAGSVFVPLDQPDAKLAVHLLEPQAPDSLVAWGFFNAIFEQKEYAEHYVLERLAREMLEADAALREEFEAKLQADPDFSADSRARLYFFYRRSPYWDDRKDVYPIARVIKPLETATD